MNLASRVVGRSVGRLVVATVAVGAVLPACSGAAHAPALPTRPEIVEVGMKEFRFEYRRPVAAGRVVLQVRNDGALHHRLTMVPLDEDMPAIDEQLRGTDRRTLTALASIPDVAADEQASIAVDLVAGVRYGMVCFLTDADGRPHALKGMASEFRAGGPDAEPPSTMAPP